MSRCSNLFALVSPIAVFLAVFAAVLPTVSESATYYVDWEAGNDTSGNGSQGNPWKTVRKAAQTISDGDVVYIAPGTYLGPNGTGEYLAPSSSDTNTQWIGTGDDPDDVRISLYYPAPFSISKYPDVNYPDLYYMVVTGVTINCIHESNQPINALTRYRENGSDNYWRLSSSNTGATGEIWTSDVATAKQWIDAMHGTWYWAPGTSLGDTLLMHTMDSSDPQNWDTDRVLEIATEQSVRVAEIKSDGTVVRNMSFWGTDDNGSGFYVSNCNDVVVEDVHVYSGVFEMIATVSESFQNTTIRNVRAWRSFSVRGASGGTDASGLLIDNVDCRGGKGNLFGLSRVFGQSWSTPVVARGLSIHNGFSDRDQSTGAPVFDPLNDTWNPPADSATSSHGLYLSSGSVSTSDTHHILFDRCVTWGTYDGIWIGDAADIRVWNCVLGKNHIGTSDGQEYLTFENTTRADARNGIFYGDGANSPSGRFINIVGSTSFEREDKLNYNVFLRPSGTGSSESLYSIGGSDYSLEEVQSAGFEESGVESWGGDGNGWFVDPSFVGHDYHLVAGSPAIDAGDPLFDDYCGDAIDSGAFEYLLVTPEAVLRLLSGGGYIHHTSGGDTVNDGVNPVVGRSTNWLSIFEDRGYCRFDTDGLVPDSANVEMVELLFDVSTVYGSGGPSVWKHAFYLGEFIDGVIDAGDWNAGNQVLEHEWNSTPDDTWIDLGETALDYVNLDGFTDVAIRDVSTLTSGTGSWNVVLDKCRLRITYRCQGDQMMATVESVSEGRFGGRGSGEPVGNATARGFGIETFPHPMGSAGVIEFTTPGRGTVRVELLDPAGRRLGTVYEASLERGDHQVIWRPEDWGLTTGMYFLRANWNGETLTRKVVVMR